MAKLTFKYVPPENLPGVPAAPAADDATLERPARERHGARSFHESSWDLQRGLQVSEDVDDDIPHELFEQLFLRT